tara:strand:- start:46870 stop:47049 length:180 start_codon:yes stop_codon:yes gene_type:complete
MIGIFPENIVIFKPEGAEMMMGWYQEMPNVMAQGFSMEELEENLEEAYEDMMDYLSQQN